MELEFFFRQILGKKFSSIKFHENPSSGSWVVQMQANGRTERQDEAEGRLSQYKSIINAMKWRGGK
jgi:hypothetical protein